jgi:hypothetical protein
MPVRETKPLGDIRHSNLMAILGQAILGEIFFWRKGLRFAVFEWLRERQHFNYRYGANRSETLRATATVPENHLFNISAYKPGEYLQFFNDPRTREQYLKWAPILLTAEDYWSENQ